MKPLFDTLADVPMIARARLFGNPERGRCTISPCGRWLAFSAPRDGVMNLWVCERDADLASARPLTNDRHRGIDSGSWTIDGRHLLYEQDRDGDEQYHLYAVSVADGNKRDLTPGTDVRAALQGGSRRHPGDVLVMVHERDPRFADLYCIEVATGERRLVQHNTGFDGFVTDDDFRIRLALQAADDGSLHLLRPAEPDQWTPWITIGRDDAMTTHPMHVDEGGRTLYLLDSRGRDTSAIVSLDLEADAPRPVVVASDPRADVAGTIDDVLTHRPLAYVVNVERIERHLLDEQLRPDFEFLDAQGLGDWRPGARSLDDRWWCVHASGDVRLPSTWLYDRHERRVRKLFDAYPQLAGAPLARMQPRTLAARDGLPLVCYLTLPRHADPGDRDWISRDRVPLVLLVHGGPWARDEWGYHPEHQWLANRGYAVLSVNFRGSTGFGKHFISAGDLEWGGRMDDDLVDAVDHVVALGIADPARIAIMGSSYGGYAVLWGLTNHPDRYACGVDIVGPSNLETLLESLPPHWESARAMLHQQVGDPTTPAGRRLLQERSPLHRADRIRRPLLIGQGANDPRVPQAEADRMVAAMKANGIPVTYVLYPDEGHGFERPANAIAFNAIVERFLARHLGGRFEPATAQEIAGHSTVMVEGRDDAPL